MYRNAPIHPFLRLIYFLIRALTWFGINTYYRRRRIVGREHLKFDGPAIVVVNHPSTLLDVLNSCLHIRQEPFFLANYGMFKHPVMNWILTRFFCIPVKRREDVTTGEARNNDEAFEKSFQHLEKNGLLFIAAEGVSWMERWVRPFKSGAARIALGAEKRQDWSLGVKIIPIGLSYSAPNLFRSEVLVHYGAPIEVGKWATLDQENHHKAVTALTQEMEQAVRDLVLDTRDETGQQFITQLELLLEDQFPDNNEDYFEFRKALIEKNIDNQALRSKLEDYSAALEKTGIRDREFNLSGKANGGRRFSALLFLLLGLPFFIIGYSFWFLPCYLPWYITKQLNLYIGYQCTVKLLSGMLTFQLALIGTFFLGLYCLGSWTTALLLVFGLVLLGYFSEQYLAAFHRWRGLAWARSLKKGAPALFEDLQKQRAEIMKMVA